MISLNAVTVTAAPFTIRLPGDPSSWGAIVLKNESAYQLNVQYDGSQRTIAAWSADLIPLRGQSAQLDVTTALILPNVQQPANQLSIDLYGVQDKPPSGVYPVELSRQVQTAAGSQVAFDGHSGVANGVEQQFSIPSGTQAVLVLLGSAGTTPTAAEVAQTVKVRDVGTGFIYQSVAQQGAGQTDCPVSAALGTQLGVTSTWTGGNATVPMMVVALFWSVTAPLQRVIGTGAAAALSTIPKPPDYVTPFVVNATTGFGTLVTASGTKLRKLLVACSQAQAGLSYVFQSSDQSTQYLELPANLTAPFEYDFEGFPLVPGDTLRVAGIGGTVNGLYGVIATDA